MFGTNWRGLRIKYICKCICSWRKMLQSSLRPYHQEVTKTSEHARNYGGGNPLVLGKALPFLNLEGHAKRLKKKKKTNGSSITFLEATVLQAEPQLRGTRDGGLQIPFGQKEGRSRRRGPERETPRATNQRAGQGEGGGRRLLRMRLPCSGLARPPACLRTASSRCCGPAPGSPASLR